VLPLVTELVQPLVTSSALLWAMRSAARSAPPLARAWEEQTVHASVLVKAHASDYETVAPLEMGLVALSPHRTT